ncbi:uncharacterized protein LOC120659313 [Panicum virgatum]|uniref:Uncharacterized protein n=1 Tax=Panicum virgatum TaxID=38727 RepID=A0A8T0VFM3_PANVG|nr:uncharacterized protein LOC120659313 [Panicum virgatum]KAG2631593.1 hypothetical protein PVAP13_2NG036000 [Panicum virgatum]
MLRRRVSSLLGDLELEEAATQVIGAHIAEGGEATGRLHADVRRLDDGHQPVNADYEGAVVEDLGATADAAEEGVLIGDLELEGAEAQAVGAHVTEGAEAIGRLHADARRHDNRHQPVNVDYEDAGVEELSAAGDAAEEGVLIGGLELEGAEDLGADAEHAKA